MDHPAQSALVVEIYINGVKCKFMARTIFEAVGLARTLDSHKECDNPWADLYKITDTARQE